MPVRPRRGAFGLRGRIVGAVLVTTVATLAVAALALLPRLEQSLRNESKTTLVQSAGVSVTVFERLPLKYVLDFNPGDPQSGEGSTPQHPNHGEGRVERVALQTQEQVLSNRLGATVTLFGYPGRSGNSTRIPTETCPPSGAPNGCTVLVPPSDELLPSSDVRLAFLERDRRPIAGFGTIDGTEVVRVAFPLENAHQRYVLEVNRSINEVAGAVQVVRNAFLTAALAGLVLTLIIGIPLSAKLVRRLRNLRVAALELAGDGRAVELPVDRARDEVGDLARAFAIMQRRLQHQEEARRAFVATASHELRTPLTSLDGMLELIADDLGDSEPDLDDARALLERARAQSRRLGRLAADLLDLSRIDADVQLRSEPVELSELSRAVLAEFELGTSERGVLSMLDDTAGPVWALGDPGSVARILRILLDNAIAITPEGTEVRVELRDGDAGPSLSVCDNGPGVPVDERELIFERFKRGRDTSGRAGFGLGLAIGRELAQRMGGTLMLEDSDQPGARFTLTLPATRAPEAEPVGAL